MNSRVALITYLDGAGGDHPDQGLPGGPPPHPWLPGYAGGPRPDQGLPPAPGRPSHGLPVPPVYPDQGLPGASSPDAPVQLPVFPYDPANLPADGAPPKPTHPISGESRFKLKWSICGWYLVPAEPAPAPK
jgi:hypothetical protein